MTQLELRQRKAVPRGVPLRDAVPGEMLDRDARLHSGRGLCWLEADAHGRALFGAKALLAPAEHQLVRRFPAFDAPDLELGAVAQRHQEAAPDAWLEAQRARVLFREPEEGAG